MARKAECLSCGRKIAKKYYIIRGHTVWLVTNESIRLINPNDNKDIFEMRNSGKVVYGISVCYYCFSLRAKRMHHFPNYKQTKKYKHGYRVYNERKETCKHVDVCDAFRCKFKGGDVHYSYINPCLLKSKQ